MPEDYGANDRLESWKEIAAYLHRTERTVIRWEKKRHLPVHRLPGGQAVFAYRHELDVWLNQEKTLDSRVSDSQSGLSGPTACESSLGFACESENEQGHSFAHAGNEDEKRIPNPSMHLPTSNPTRDLEGVGKSQLGFRWRAWILSGVISLLAAGILSAWLSPPTLPLAARPFSFKQLTHDGISKGNLRTDGLTLYFNQTEGARSVLASMPASGGTIRPIVTTLANAVLQDLSKDGKTLLIKSVEGIVREGSLWTVSTQGGVPQRVSDVMCTSARWSPDNRKIACGSSNNVIVMDAKGANARRVGAFISRVAEVAWTPDGTMLRVALEDATQGLSTYSPWEVAVNESGTALPSRPLPLDANCCLDWSWTENGRFAVYLRIDPNGSKRMMTAPENGFREGTAETELPARISDINGLASTAKGRTLYLVTSNSTRGELMKFDVERRRFESFLVGLSASNIAFSPDRQWITYTTEDGTLFRSRADGSERLPLSTPPMYAEVSSWSPDGHRVAFMARVPGKPYRIYLVGRDGGPVEEAAEGNDGQGGPSWSPDGRMLVYGNVSCVEMDQCWIRTLNLASRTAEIVPGSHGFRTARWSPGGEYIAALQPQTHRLMLLNFGARSWRTLAESVTGDNINWSSDAQSVYVDSLRDKKPVVERVRIKDGQRVTVMSLTDLEKLPGQIDGWIGLHPADNSPIVLHRSTVSEIYSLDWAN